MKRPAKKRPRRRVVAGTLKIKFAWTLCGEPITAQEFNSFLKTGVAPSRILKQHNEGEIFEDRGFK